jgi:hypothetical protein
MANFVHTDGPPNFALCGKYAEANRGLVNYSGGYVDDCCHLLMTRRRSDSVGALKTSGQLPTQSMQCECRGFETNKEDSEQILAICMLCKTFEKPRSVPEYLPPVLVKCGEPSVLSCALSLESRLHDLCMSGRNVALAPILGFSFNWSSDKGSSNAACTKIQMGMIAVASFRSSSVSRTMLFSRHPGHVVIGSP